MLLRGVLAHFATDCVAWSDQQEWVVREITDEAEGGTGSFAFNTIETPHERSLGFPMAVPWRSCAWIATTAFSLFLRMRHQY